MFREHRLSPPPLPTQSPNPEQAEIERWLQMSRTAGDPQTALEYAQHVVALQPNNPQAQAVIQRCLLEQLNLDPFVGFVKETDQNYIITFRSSRLITVPKAHTPPEIFPPSPATPADRALGLIWWMMLGLIPAGIGALILMPLVLWRALRILNKPQLNFREAQAAWLTFFLAGGLGVLGLFFVLLFWLHLI